MSGDSVQDAEKQQAAQDAPSGAREPVFDFEAWASEIVAGMNRLAEKVEKLEKARKTVKTKIISAPTQAAISVEIARFERCGWTCSSVHCESDSFWQNWLATMKKRGP